LSASLPVRFNCPPFTFLPSASPSLSFSSYNHTNIFLPSSLPSFLNVRSILQSLLFCP
jgi:hypothetical protein